VILSPVCLRLLMPSSRFSSYEKNLLLLISAFEILRRELPSQTSKMKLVFVGDGPARSQLEEVCKEKAIDACFEGHQSGIALAERYASADIFAYAIPLI
jgi:glycosyltransferase involved in cell wall biosynthesis